jgi:DNA polymerase III subunit alpha
MSENQPFVHLHCHSEFSLLDGLSRIKELVRRAVELNQPAIALTDHGVMYGAIPFYNACQEAGIKPIIGIETYLARRTMADRDPDLDSKRFHMLLLARDQVGYRNLLQIASSAQLEGYYYKPRIDRDFMARHSEGLIATTGCMAAEIPRAIGDGNMKLAHKLMSQYLDIFGPDRLYLELQEHSIPELTEINKRLIEMAPRYGLENNFLATNDVHYTLAEDADPHQVLLCIQTSSTLKAPKLSFSDKDYYLKSYAEMEKIFGHVPGALSNSLRIAEMCEVDLGFNGYHLPDFEVPAGHTAETYLRQLCEEGLVWRYGEDQAKVDPLLQQRLNHELKLIHDMGFDTYFLIVWDLCEWAARTDRWWEQHQDPFPYDDYTEWKENDIWWNVRGSGAGSVVAYTLGITSIDPLANSLIFERFLNPGRVSMPDIDLDYPDDARHHMVAYTKRRYGEEKVAQIITFGTLGARAAIRDVGRAIEMPLPEVDAIARMIPAIPGKPAKIENVLDETHEFYSAELKQRYRAEQAVRRLLDTARNLEGISRHASSHAAGVIVSDRPLHEYVPLNRPTSGEEGLGGVDRVTQWPMEIVEEIGLLKIDFLGLSTLTVMHRAAKLIEERYGIVYTMDNIPYDVGHVGPDPYKKPEALFDMLAQGAVAGVFQVEGAGMRRLMMEMKPRRFDHIIAAISLYRPGPMDNIPEYIRRMHADIYEGKNLVEYHTPELESILNDTYGIIVYQEQIIRIAAELAGYEPGDADMIRKAVAKKKQKLMDEHRLKFTEGAMARGLSRAVCEAIWGDIEFFARYGFNKAHAADYAKVTCQTAYLKAHYPVEYLTAMLSVERDNTDKIRRYFTEAKSLGIDIAPPDVNVSHLDFTIDDGGERPLIRFGLGAIKNAGASALSLIIDEREANGPFADLQDLCERVDLRRVGKRALEFVIKGKALDQWGTPPQLLDALDRLVGYSGTQHDAAAAGQMSLFGNAGPSTVMDVNLLRPASEFAKTDYKQILEWEKEALGVHVSEHPLERPLALLSNHVSATLGELDANWHDKQVRLAGMVSSLRSLTTKKGDPMAFGTLEDLESKIDLVFFPRTWKQHRMEVKEDQVLLVTGKLQLKGDDLSLLVDSVTTNLEIARDADYVPSPSATSAPVKMVQKPQPVIRKVEKVSEGGNGRIQEKAAPTYSPPAPTNGSHQPTTGGPPPPPPNFDDSWDSPQPPAPSPQVPPEEPIVFGETKNGNGYKSQLLVVEIKPSGNWQHACRRSVKTAEQFRGQDGLRLRLVGQQRVIDFPDQQTQCCDELIDQLERIDGVQRVYTM